MRMSAITAVIDRKQRLEDHVVDLVILPMVLANLSVGLVASPAPAALDRVEVEAAPSKERMTQNGSVSGYC